MYRNGIRDISVMDEPSQPHEPFSTRKKKHQSSSRKQHNFERMEKYRERLSTEFFNDHVSKVRSELLSGLRYEKEILSQDAAEVTVDVSTRGIGFSLVAADADSDDVESSTPVDCSTSSCNYLPAYRVGLYAMESRVLQIRDHCSVGLRAKRLPEQVFSKAFFERDVVAGLPLQTLDVIRSVGKISLGRQTVLPNLPDYSQPQAEGVKLSNLRRFVVALADPTYPLEIRQWFFHNNPIPGALVENNVLKNPDEIMPSDYGESHLRDDLQFICDHPIGNTKALGLTQPIIGSHSQLLTSTMGNLRIGPNLTIQGDSRVRSSHSFTLTDDEIRQGVLFATGEIPVYRKEFIYDGAVRAILKSYCGEIERGWGS